MSPASDEPQAVGRADATPLCSLRRAITAYGPRKYCSIRCRNTALSRRVAARIRKTKPPTPIKQPSPWTPEAIEYLKQHYATDGAKSVAEHLSLPVKAVYSRAQALKLRQTPETRKRGYENIREHMRTNNPMHQPEALERMRAWWEAHPEASDQRWAKFLEGKQAIQSDKPTKLEQRLFAILTELGVAFEAFALIKPKFIVDARIGPLVIQADGEYWHGHPRFDPLTERQRKQRERDASQDAYLHACGYSVVRVWDRDVHTANILAILQQHQIV